MKKQLIPGLYEHYKGKKYLVLGTALNTETILVDRKDVLRFRYVGELNDSGILNNDSQLERIFQSEQ